MADNMYPEDSAVQSTIGIQSERHQSPSIDEKVPAKRGRFQGVVLFEVESSELDSLERGTDASVWLNFAISTASIFLTIFSSLLTLDVDKNKTAFVVFVMIACVTFLFSILCFVFWWRKRVSQSEIINKIRGRIQ